MRRFTALDLKTYLEECAQNQSDGNSAPGDTCKEMPMLLDVREPWEYEKCHLNGSQLIPMREIPYSLDKLDPDKETVVICHHGIRSRQVAYYLEQAGFDKVINLEGGVEAWAQDVDPDMQRY
ncbi:MAG: rhodanese-like domain-containing protein [Thioalkalispiraceae bacterium]|jgi:rhodanese-related sulfurtransferase